MSRQINNRWVTDKEFKELVERDTARAMKQYVFKALDRPPLDECPVCEKPIISDEYKFCPYCGQRLDRENYEF